ncbi:hypothetical protein OEZ85_005380 [Tetradesmus obliquus]|uniref:Uncharacterized protein n=1 Tax=Tetradesmus obliquus TaxID=3088 RepID=A0ABY8UHQ0_TETOB|nr:hypothetical protein OEZ85_005380 [Tetradesmus obliquus]
MKAQASGGALGSGCGSGPGFGGAASAGGLGFGGLAAMDPADLAELASWWRPRLDSAERRYLRCRKQQMDEALLQASQPDGEEARDNTLGSPEFHPRSVLFGSPLGDTPGAAAAADGTAIGAPSGAAATAVAGAAAAADYNG